MLHDGRLSSRLCLRLFVMCLLLIFMKALFDGKSNGVVVGSNCGGVLW